MESLRRGAAIRPPDPGEQIKTIVSAIFIDIDIQRIWLKVKADQNNALQLICDESRYIWWEINHLLHHEPSRLLCVWNQIKEYREVLLDIHIAVDRDPSLLDRDIVNFCNILHDILDIIRNASGGARNHPNQHCSGSNFVQGARNVNMNGGRYAIYNYNTGPELVQLYIAYIWATDNRRSEDPVSEGCMAALTLARVYQHSFHAYPNWTLAITGGCLSAAGDIVAQLTQNAIGGKDRDDRPLFDMLRTTRFFCYGLAMSPAMGRWNVFLERRFPSCSPQIGKLSIKSLSKRVAADQLIMAPIGLGIFIGAMGLLEGRSPGQIKERFQDMYGSLLLANWKVWPVAQLVNFRYMPLPYRVPFSQTVGVFWTLYLSIVNSEEDRLQDRAAALKKGGT